MHPYEHVMQTPFYSAHPGSEQMTLDAMLASGYNVAAFSHIMVLETEVCALRKLVAELLVKNQELRANRFLPPDRSA